VKRGGGRGGEGRLWGWSGRRRGGVGREGGRNESGGKERGGGCVRGWVERGGCSRRESRGG